MLCYKDMTFCQYYKDCAKAKDCERPLTPAVLKAAKKWNDEGFGLKYPAIAQFGCQPRCHVTKTPRKRTKKKDTYHDQSNGDGSPILAAEHT